MNKYIVKAEKYGYVSEEYFSRNICLADNLEQANEIVKNLNNCADSFEVLCKKYLEFFNLKKNLDQEDLFSFLKKEGDKNQIKYYELLLCFYDEIFVDDCLFSSMDFVVEEIKFVAKA